MKQGISSETREHIEEHGRVEIDAQRVDQVKGKGWKVTLVVCPAYVLIFIRLEEYSIGHIVNTITHGICLYTLYPMVLEFIESMSFRRVCKACCNGCAGWILALLLTAVFIAM